jgi:murein DD-endopeptidase MepM/ murein hydrolase activator NlpD
MARNLGRGLSAPRWVRFAVPALALVVVAATALVAGPALILQGSGPSSSSVPSATVTPQPTATATASATQTPTLPPVVGVTAWPPPPPTPIPASLLTGYVWPLKDAKITLPFGPSKWGELLVNGKLSHDGLDMATQCGDKVMAAHDGTVLVASRDYIGYMGWQGDLTAFKKKSSPPSFQATMPVVIVINDGNGYNSIYAHEWSVKVKPGQHVTAGQVIGIEGDSGHATGCHLHFGLFSRFETATFDNLPDYITRLHLPATITARIDPLLVLPYRNDLSEMRKLRPAEASAWASAHPSK